MDWLPQSSPGDHGYATFLNDVDLLVMGRKTYDQILRLGPWPHGDRRCVVFSRGRARQREGQAEFVEGDVASIVADLRAGPGGTIWLVGGAEIVAPCLVGRVVDEIIVTILPILLGEGIPLFQPIARPAPLRLRRSQGYPDGLVQLTYDVVR